MRIIKTILLIAIFFSIVSVCLSREKTEEIIERKVFPEVFINEDFYGFGAETLPWLWTQENKRRGVNEDDIMLNLERIKDMQMPITRIFVPWETWNPSADYKTFTWESDEKKSLYNMLDLYEYLGTDVIIVTVDWLEDAPWKNVSESSNAVLRLLEHLIKVKGYTCIKFWPLTNEPEFTYNWLDSMSFEDYVRIHKLIKKGIERRGLPVKIIASDEVESPKWFAQSLQSLSETADVFSSHAYFDTEDMDSVSIFLEDRVNAIKQIGKNTPFFLCEFGFRGHDFGVRHNSLIEDYEYGLLTADLA